MKIVLAHGCFDVLHVGHLRLLKFAVTLGDWLVVSIASDEHILDWKGKRPANCEAYRKEMLLAFGFVDEVIITDGLGVAATCAMIERVRPSVYVKGREYEGRLADQTTVEHCGGRVVFFDEFDKLNCSSSVLIENRI